MHRGIINCLEHLYLHSTRLKPTILGLASHSAPNTFTEQLPIEQQVSLAISPLGRFVILLRIKFLPHTARINVLIVPIPLAIHHLHSVRLELPALQLIIPQRVSCLWPIVHRVELRILNASKWPRRSAGCGLGRVLEKLSPRVALDLLGYKVVDIEVLSRTKCKQLVSNCVLKTSLRYGAFVSTNGIVGRYISPGAK